MYVSIATVSIENKLSLAKMALIDQREPLMATYELDHILDTV